MLTLTFHPTGADSPPDDQNRLQKAKDKLRALVQGPSSGRTTRQGRKVEKPGDARPAGPSGQRDQARHDRQHANK